jgi:hypothetical protein
LVLKGLEVVMKDVSYALSCDKVCRSHHLEIPGANGSPKKVQELWTLTVRAKNLPRYWKLGPNARYANLKAKPAKDMLATLSNDPESFVLKNNGMMVVAKSLRSEGNQVELVCSEPDETEFAPGHGVLNGGHTYTAIKEALADPKKYPGAGEAVVLVTVGLGIDEEEISRISKARNTSEKVPLHALRNLDGDWTDLKKHLPPESRHLVFFKPNEPDVDADAGFDVTDLVRRLAVMNNELFPAENGDHPVRAYSGIGALVRQYDKNKFTKLAERLPDMLRLEELVVRKYEELYGRGRKDDGKEKIDLSRTSGCSSEPSTLLTGYRASVTIADPFVLPVMAAFRVFLQDGEWVMPMEDAWSKYGERVIRDLWKAYREEGKSSASYFARSAKSSWAPACDHTKNVAIQLGFLKIDP